MFASFDIKCLHCLFSFFLSSQGRDRLLAALYLSSSMNSPFELFWFTLLCPLRLYAHYFSKGTHFLQLQGLRRCCLLYLKHTEASTTLLPKKLRLVLYFYIASANVWVWYLSHRLFKDPFDFHHFVELSGYFYRDLLTAVCPPFLQRKTVNKTEENTQPIGVYTVVRRNRE